MPEEIFDEYGNNIFVSVYDTDPMFFDEKYLEAYINSVNNGTTHIFHKEIEEHLKRALSRSEEEEITTWDMRCIVTNPIEKYFAQRISWIDGDFNNYIDKKFRIVVDKDLNSRRFMYSEEGDTIVIHIGILNTTYKKINKGAYLNYNPELKKMMLEHKLIEYSREMDEFFSNDEWKEVLERYIKDIPTTKEIINGLLEQHEDSITDDLAEPEYETPKMSRRELYEMMLQFLHKYDKTSKLCTMFTEAVKNDRIKKATEHGAHVEVDTGDIFIEYNDTADDFISLAHEFMHHASVENHNSQKTIISEFPSIYFEYLAKYYAEGKGIKTNFQIERNKLAMNKLYELLFALNIVELHSKYGYSPEKYKELLEEFNMPEEVIIKYLVDHPPITLVTNSNYLVGLLLAKQALSEGIDPSVITEISTHMNEYTPEQVAAMLNVPGFTNSEEIETETAMAM